jgi:Ca-activated chloride channel family protein
VVRIGFVVLALVCATQAGRAQAPALPTTKPPLPTTFRAAVELVALNVVATDGQDKVVNGLEARNFAVFEDGVPQEVAFFGTSEVPLDLAILLDTSASMGEKMGALQQAAIGFASTVREGDRLTVVDINDAYKVLLPLTADRDGVADIIRGITARGGTALYNGVYMTLKELVRQRIAGPDVRRQALVVLSDGADTTSLLSFDDVMDVAKQAGIAVYTITLRSRLPVNPISESARQSHGEFAMKSLALETGAKAYFPAEVTELATVYGAIATELSAQYALGYTSTNATRDGKYRRVSVRTVDRPGVRLRTRAGYIAPRTERVTSTQ